MLEVNNIGFSYPNGAVLDGLSLEVAEGETVGLVGPNGSGKTTLMRLVTGVLYPETGDVRVGGLSMAGLSSKERAKRVAIVPQNPQLPLSFSVLDLVLMGRNAHLGLLQWEGERDVKIAVEAMETTETLHLASRAIDTLSGGEQQRAVVATALAQQAPVLLLDEPTSSLDLAHQSKVMELVGQTQRRRGGVVLMGMHDLTLAGQYCDRIVMLAEGRAYASGRPRDVLTAKNIRDVYDADVTVMSHPTTGTPVVVPAASGGGENR